MGELVKYLLSNFEALPWWGKLIALAVLGGGLLAMSLRFVKEGERGLRLRFGQVVRRNGVPVIVEPGFALIVPKVEQLQRRHVRQQTVELQEQQVILKDNSIWMVSAVVFFRVNDVYKALIEIDDLDAGVRNLCMGELRSVLQSLAGVEDIKDIEGVSAALLAATSERAKDWGIELIGFRLTNCMPSAETASAVTARGAVLARMAALREVGVVGEPLLAAALLGVPAVAAVSARKEAPAAAPAPQLGFWEAIANGKDQHAQA